MDLDITSIYVEHGVLLDTMYRIMVSVGGVTPELISGTDTLHFVRDWGNGVG
jgi:hypothetical protein